MAELDMQTETVTVKRGGAKCSGVHITLLIASTFLLTLAAIFLIKDMNVAGVITLILGLVARVIDTRVS